MNDRLIIKAGIVALIIFLLLGLIDGFIAVQLREASSWIAYYMLDLVSFPIEKAGTMLKTPRMDFDVVPACSGSTTLRVMIFVGIVWTAMQEKMSVFRKACLLSVVFPLALISNGIRISILVLIGYSMYKPVEGVLHELTGMATFALAFGGLLLSTQLIQHDGKNRSEKSPKGIRIATLAVLFILVYSNFGFWCLNGWRSSPLDHYGYLFVLAGVVGGIYSWRKTVYEPCNNIVVFFLAVTSLLVLVISSVADINILAGASCVAFVFAAVYGIGGRQRIIHAAPFIVVAASGVPTVTFVLNKVLVAVGLPGSKFGIAVKLVFALLMLAGGVWAFRRKCENETVFVLPVRIIDWLACALVMMLAVKVYFNSSAASNAHPGELKVSYVLGDWVGRKSMDFQMNPAINYQDTWMRSYTDGAHRISMTVTASGGDRHQLHPPEYCLTGGGWTLNDEKKVSYAFLPGVESEITEMLLDKHEAGSYFVYWFTDGVTVFPNYRSMLAEDTLRRLRNIQTKWFLFRLVAPSKKVLFENFLPQFKGEIKVDGSSYHF